MKSLSIIRLTRFRKLLVLPFRTVQIYAYNVYLSWYISRTKQLCVLFLKFGWNTLEFIY